MAFRGTFDHTLDAKNRLTIPAKFRAALSEGVVLAKGIERCVQVWTRTEVEGWEEPLHPGPLSTLLPHIPPLSNTNCTERPT